MAKDFLCPNCLRRFAKDDSILMLTAGAAVVGEGVSLSGRLEEDLPKIKRLKYCKICRGAIDFHALLRGRLDYVGGTPYGLAVALLAAPTLLFGAGLSWWLAVPAAAAAGIAVGLAVDRMELRRIKSYRLSDEQVRTLGGTPAADVVYPKHSPKILPLP